ncbi:MAG: hypothetical protein SGARI_002982, partial [Bacillariaceae sp.]
GPTANLNKFLVKAELARLLATLMDHAQGKKIVMSVLGRGDGKDTKYPDFVQGSAAGNNRVRGGGGVRVRGVQRSNARELFDHRAEPCVDTKIFKADNKTCLHGLSQLRELVK